MDDANRLFRWMTDIQMYSALPGFYIVYEGWRFSAPFLCMCCGKETLAEQWAFGRTCGRCDTGACQDKRGGYDHGFPEFFVTGGREARLQRYCEFVEAVPDS